MKILRLIAVFIFFGFLAAAASFCIYQSVVIGNAVAAIDSMGGAVRDEYDSLGAPVGVTLKLIGRNSSATDANVAKKYSGVTRTNQRSHAERRRYRRE